jgi:hypothetical protein
MIIDGRVRALELSYLLPARRGVCEDKYPTATFRVVRAPHDCSVARNGYREAELVSRIALQFAGNGA